jgi:hypothetical protein
VPQSEGASENNFAPHVTRPPASVSIRGKFVDRKNFEVLEGTFEYLRNGHCISLTIMRADGGRQGFLIDGKKSVILYAPPGETFFVSDIGLAPKDFSIESLQAASPKRFGNWFEYIRNIDPEILVEDEFVARSHSMKNSPSDPFEDGSERCGNTKLWTTEPGTNVLSLRSFDSNNSKSIDKAYNARIQFDEHGELLKLETRGIGANSDNHFLTEIERPTLTVRQVFRTSTKVFAESTYERIVEINPKLDAKDFDGSRFNYRVQSLFIPFFVVFFFVCLAGYPVWHRITKRLWGTKRE